MLLITSVKEFQATPRQGQKIFVIVLVDAQFMKKFFCEESNGSLIIKTEESTWFVEDEIYYPQQRGKKRGSD